MKKTYRNMALAAACVLTATGLWGCSTSVQIPDTVKVQQGESSDNRITVSGMEEVKAVPDIAQIQYSVYTQAATAQECQEENAKNINQTLETLNGLGVEDKSIQTSDYGMNPIYDWTSGQQKITGYQMTTSITVSDIPVENAGKIITDSVASGVNELDSVQYLTNLYVNKKRRGDDYCRIIVDSETYRAKRQETLIRLANSMANKACKYHKDMSLEPMTPYERRIIHSALQNVPNVKTRSVGEEPNRRVIVMYKK